MSVEKTRHENETVLFASKLYKSSQVYKVFYSTSITLKTRSQKRSFSTESYFLQAGMGTSLELKQSSMKNESKSKC